MNTTLAVIVEQEFFKENEHIYSSYDVKWELEGNDYVCEIEVTEEDYEHYMESRMGTFDILNEYAVDVMEVLV